MRDLTTVFSVFLTGVIPLRRLNTGRHPIAEGRKTADNLQALFLNLKYRAAEAICGGI